MARLEDDPHAALAALVEHEVGADDESPAPSPARGPPPGRRSAGSPAPASRPGRRRRRSSRRPPPDRTARRRATPARWPRAGNPRRLTVTRLAEGDRTTAGSPGDEASVTDRSARSRQRAQTPRAGAGRQDGATLAGNGASRPSGRSSAHPAGPRPRSCRGSTHPARFPKRRSWDV